MRMEFLIRRVHQWLHGNGVLIKIGVVWRWRAAHRTTWWWLLGMTSSTTALARTTTVPRSPTFSSRSHTHGVWRRSSVWGSEPIFWYTCSPCVCMHNAVCSLVLLCRTVFGVTDLQPCVAKTMYAWFILNLLDDTGGRRGR